MSIKQGFFFQYLEKLITVLHHPSSHYYLALENLAINLERKKVRVGETYQNIKVWFLLLRRFILVWMSH